MRSPIWRRTGAGEVMSLAPYKPINSRSTVICGRGNWELRREVYPEIFLLLSDNYINVKRKTTLISSF